MKRLLLALVPLVFSAAALADTITGYRSLNRLAVQASPEYVCDCIGYTSAAERLFVAKGGVQTVWFESDLPTAEFRYILERKTGDQLVAVAGSVWQSGIEQYQIDTADADIPPGNYRLRILARKPDTAEILEKSLLMKVVGPADPNFTLVSNATIVSANYVDAVIVVRRELARIKGKLLRGESVAAEYRTFSSNDRLIISLINPEDSGAPEGGNAYLSAGGDDGVGAVGVRIEHPPASPTDWRGVTITVDMPNYLGMEETGIGEVHQTIRWEDVAAN